MTTTTTYYDDDTMMTPQQLLRVWNSQQRRLAKEGISKEERAKKSISKLEFYNKLMQFGYRLRYKDITLELDEDTGWTLLTIGKKKIWQATIGDLINAVHKYYGATIKYDAF